MEIVESSVEYWNEGSNPNTHVARCASVCYALTKINEDKIIDLLIERKHLSVFRHKSHYYVISKNSKAGYFIGCYNGYSKVFGNNPYFELAFDKKNVYISTNHQYILEHPYLEELIKPYEVNFDEFANYKKAKELLRFTFCITTSIKVSRELNRVSPNNITEQSTRYVNFGTKFGDVKVCKSVDEHLSEEDKNDINKILTQETFEYIHLVETGVKPEDARRVLPLDTATKVVYTYSAREWRHIIDLRWFEITGPAAPDAKLIAGKLYDIFKMLGYYE